MVVFGRFSPYLCPINVRTEEALWKKEGFWYRAFDLYYDGFRSMTLGKVLWTVILIKLFIIFVVLKVFFFPDFLKQHAEKGGEADFVARAHRSTAERNHSNLKTNQYAMQTYY